jgi:hypothetical protein
MDDIIDKINKTIENVQKQVLSGEITLLNYELVSLFTDLEDSLNKSNLETSSEMYKDACLLLNQKFEDLKALLNSLKSEEKLMHYLRSNPSDSELYLLIKESWREVFTINAISLDFLEASQEKLAAFNKDRIIIDHLVKSKVKEDFLLEIDTQKFTDKMLRFFKSIKDKLPCAFDEVFEKNITKEELYEHFVYLLHLLQLGKVKYLKETNTLFL